MSVRARGPVQTAPAGGSPWRRRRSLSLALTAVLVAAGSSLGFALLWRGAAARQPVLAVTGTVLAGEVIEPSDLAVALVAADPLVSPIPASEQSRVTGLTAASDLVAGTLLTEAQLGPELLLGPEESLVGVRLRGGQSPAARLRAGDRVQVVQTLPAGQAASGSAPGLLVGTGRVFTATAEADPSGAAHVSLAVDARIAPWVAGAAAADQVSLILVRAS